MSDSGSDNLRDELGRVAFDLARNQKCDDRTWDLVKGNNDLLFWPTADAFVPVVERRVAEATAPLEARIKAVESIHFPRKMTVSGDNKMTLCNQCSALSGNAYLLSSQWPCATVRALASGQEGEQ